MQLNELLLIFPKYVCLVHQLQSVLLQKALKTVNCHSFYVWWMNGENGPSEVRAPPLGVAVEQSVHYFGDYFSFFFSSLPHTFLPEGVVLGL